MKFQVGDKVRYESGDWWFYATVTAVIENSICPGYRLSVDSMAKKNCKFSITQFEFELEADNEDESGKIRDKWDNLEIEFLKRYYKIPTKETLSEVILPSIPELISKPSELTPEEKHKIEPELSSEPVPEKVEPPHTPKEDMPKEDMTKQKSSDVWDRNLELYRKGDRSKKIHSWISLNRKQYKSDELPQEKREKLMAIDFPFEARAKKAPKGSWGSNIELWKKGERKTLQEWRQKSVKLYVEGKLGKDKIENLKDLGILK